MGTASSSDCHTTYLHISPIVSNLSFPSHILKLLPFSTPSIGDDTLSFLLPVGSVTLSRCGHKARRMMGSCVLASLSAGSCAIITYSEPQWEASSSLPVDRFLIQISQKYFWDHNSQKVASLVYMHVSVYSGKPQGKRPLGRHRHRWIYI
jgi:hypothetical protein